MTDKVTTFACTIRSPDLDHWLELEQQYLIQNAIDREALLTQLENNNDPMPLALLLSQPSSTAIQLQKALKLYSGFSLDPGANCLGNRYLYIRQAHAKALSRLKSSISSLTRERDDLIQEQNNLAKQIEELTAIEQDITQQRESDGSKD